MPPSPLARPAGLLRVPAPGARHVEARFALLAARDQFDPLGWQRQSLRHDPAAPGYYQLDLDTLGLPDGDYEYELVIDDLADIPVPDPLAVEITRFGGYRGIFHILGGRRVHPAFHWEDELPAGQALPGNNALVIYELPLRWVAGESPDRSRQIGLGDFDHLIFAHLESLAELGINCIELLPIQDSADTLNWGYGTRFFLAPDVDLGAPVDVKLFIKRCHQRGIRIILDVVMNHARECPLETLASDWFFLPKGSTEEGDRPDWGGRVFRYRRPAPDGTFPARDFHYAMAEFWVREYHVDGFRIDEFKGIDHWEFVQTFRERAWASHQALFPNRPFIIIAEDSWRRVAAAQDHPGNPGGRKVVDAIWNFAFRDEARRLLHDQVTTVWGQPARSERVRGMVSGQRMWNDWDHSFADGFGDLAQAVNYITSHDVEKEGEQRFVNYIFGDLLRLRWLGSGSVAEVRTLVDEMAAADARVRQAHAEALDRAGSAFALLLTAVGIPMFLAGEEFGDVHDLDHSDWRLKMSDPVDWARQGQPGHQALRQRVRDLVQLRTASPALQRNEVTFFYFHPSFDESDGVRVFAYCRTGGQMLGSSGQVVVLANAGPHDFPAFEFPWPWAGAGEERGQPPSGSRPDFRPDRPVLSLSLAPFQVRVFAV